MYFLMQMCPEAETMSSSSKNYPAWLTDGTPKDRPNSRKSMASAEAWSEGRDANEKWMLLLTIIKLC